jgi:hypothetical protein
MRLIHANWDDYVVDPAGRYVCGPSWVLWEANAAVGGLILRRRVDVAAARDIVAAATPTMLKAPAGFLALFDVRAIEYIDADALAVLAEELAPRARKASGWRRSVALRLRCRQSWRW